MSVLFQTYSSRSSFSTTKLLGIHPYARSSVRASLSLSLSLSFHNIPPTSPSIRPSLSTSSLHSSLIVSPFLPTFSPTHPPAHLDHISDRKSCIHARAYVNACMYASSQLSFHTSRLPSFARVPSLPCPSLPRSLAPSSPPPLP